MSHRLIRPYSGFALPVGLALVLISACSKQDAEKNSVIRPVRTAVVTATSAMTRRTYPAVVLPNQQAELAFKVSGQIVELPVAAAQQVKNGDVVAQLDKREFESTVELLTSELEQAKLQLVVMKSGERDEVLAVLQARVDSAKAQLQQQRRTVDRSEQLAKSRAISQSELEAAVAKLASDEANLRIADEELKTAEAGERAELVEAQEAAIQGLESRLSQAKTNLDDTTLRAPFDGVIARRNVDNFANVSAKTTVAVVQKLDKIDIQFDVPGADVAAYGQQKDSTVNKVRLDAAPDREFDAQLVEFDTQADPATQTFRGRLSIDYPEDFTVLPGMTGSVIVSASSHDQESLTLPESALAAEPDGSTYVWVVNEQENSVTKRKVTSLSLSAGDVSVAGDVQAGDVVVTAGVSFLREGMTVRPIRPDSE